MLPSVTEEIRVQSQASPYAICSGKEGKGQDFSDCFLPTLSVPFDQLPMLMIHSSTTDAISI